MTQAARELVTTERLREFFAPKSIALVGASDNSGWARLIVASCATTGFSGPLTAVHPRATSAFGLPVVRNLRDLPEPADLAFILAPLQAVEGILEEMGNILTSRPVTEDELNNTKSYVTGSLPLQLETGGGIGRLLLDIELYELGDDYVRDTVILASVLFLVGISTQFPIRAARYTLIGLGIVILAFSVAQLLTLPIPN